MFASGKNVIARERTVAISFPWKELRYRDTKELLGKYQLKQVESGNDVTNR